MFTPQFVCLMGDNPDVKACGLSPHTGRKHCYYYYIFMFHDMTLGSETAGCKASTIFIQQ